MRVFGFILPFRTTGRLFVPLAVLLVGISMLWANELPLSETICPLAEFRSEGCIAPQAAFERYADTPTARRLGELGGILCPGMDPTQGWQYFFSTSIATLTSLTETHVLSMYYHPWSDIALLCEWTHSDGLPRISNVELVMGDILRNTKEPVSTPLWRREGDVPPSLSVVVATSDTVRGFLDIYGQRSRWFPTRWQGRLGNLKNKKQVDANNAAVSALFAQAMNAVHIYFNEDGLAPLRASMNHLRQLLLDNRGEQVVGLAAETSEESRLILTEAPLDWQQAAVVAFATDPQNAFIFLSGDDSPEVFACFWFAMGQDGSAPTLRRVDFLGHTLSFEEIDTIARQAGMKR